MTPALTHIFSPWWPGPGYLRQFRVPGVPVWRSISADGSVHRPGHCAGHPDEGELQLGDGHHHQPPGTATFSPPVSAIGTNNPALPRKLPTPHTPLGGSSVCIWEDFSHKIIVILLKIYQLNIKDPQYLLKLNV